MEGFMLHVMHWRRAHGDRTHGRPGCPSSGANHCLLVSFPLLSELLSRIAPTGRKEGDREERKARGPTGSC